MFENATNIECQDDASIWIEKEAGERGYMMLVQDESDRSVTVFLTDEQMKKALVGLQGVLFSGSAVTTGTGMEVEND